MSDILSDLRKEIGLLRMRSMGESHDTLTAVIAIIDSKSETEETKARSKKSESLKLTRIQHNADIVLIDTALAQMYGIVVGEPPSSAQQFKYNEYYWKGRLYTSDYRQKEGYRAALWSPASHTADALSLLTRQADFTLRAVDHDVWVAEYATTLDRTVESDPACAIIALAFKIHGSTAEQRAALRRIWPSDNLRSDVT